MFDIISIFCICDDFCKLFSEEFKTSPLPRNPSAMADSELMAILLGYHLSGFHDLKHFYAFVTSSWQPSFPRLISYSRFVELMPAVSIHLFAMLSLMRGQVTGTSYIDATALAVCKNKRISSHRVFKSLAKRGKTTMGWFFGFKLHLVINEYGEILAFTLTAGNVDDRIPVPDLLNGISGKVYGDKGYISQSLIEKLLEKGTKLVTALKSNMKPTLMPLDESCALGKRSLIESVFNILKNSCRLEHSRHRSPNNFVTNLLAALCAYTMRFVVGITGCAQLKDAFTIL